MMTRLAEEAARLVGALQGVIGGGGGRPPGAESVAPASAGNEPDGSVHKPSAVALDPAVVREVIAPEIERLLRRGQLGGPGGTMLGGRRRHE